MYIDLSMQFIQYLNTLEEPTKAIVSLAVCVGLPLVCIILYILDKEIIKKGEKYEK